MTRPAYPVAADLTPRKGTVGIARPRVITMSKKTHRKPGATTQPVVTNAEEVFHQAACCELSANLLLGVANCSAVLRPVMTNETISLLSPPSARLPAYEVAGLPPTLKPWLILMPLATELYLKCLIQVERTEPSTRRGHDLEQLFGWLNADTQASIKQAYEGIGKSASTFDAQFAAVSGSLASEFSFDQVLRVSSNAFETWRYSFERQMAGGVMLTWRISQCVRSAILELRPHWRRILDEFGMVKMPQSMNAKTLLPGS